MGTLLQSLISRAADEDCYVIMASLDLSMAFDLVNMPYDIKHRLAYCANSSVTSQLDIKIMINFVICNHVAEAGIMSQESCATIYNNLNWKMIIEAIAGPFYDIIKVMMKGPNRQSNNKKILNNNF